MNAADSSHALGPDLALSAAPSFAIRTSAQGLTGSEASTGATLSVLVKVTAAGSLSQDRLIESALALMQKKHPGAERIGAPESISITGSSARSALLRATTPSTVPIHIVLTAVIVPDPTNPLQQRNLIVVLEVPTAAFEQRRADYQGFAQQRLRIGAVVSAAPASPAPPASPASPAPLVLELAPMAPAEEAETATNSAAAPPPAPVRVAAGKPPSPTPIRVAAEKPPAPARARERTQSPAAPPSAAKYEDALLVSAASGQRTLAFSILLSFVARAVGNVPDVPVFLAYAIGAAVLIYAISGVLKICTGMGYSMNAKLALMFCSSVPLLGIACWVYLSIKTTRRLRAAGYQVGLFGARA